MNPTQLYSFKSTSLCCFVLCFGNSCSLLHVSLHGNGATETLHAEECGAEDHSSMLADSNLFKTLHTRVYELTSQQQHNWTSRTYEIQTCTILIHSCADNGVWLHCHTVFPQSEKRGTIPNAMCLHREALQLNALTE